MDYDLGSCLYCRRATARPADFDDHRLVAIRCQSCGARGPLVVIQDAECREAATELAAELWNGAGRLEHFEYQLTAPVRIEALDNALLNQLLEHKEKSPEPATDASDDRLLDADDRKPGSMTAEANIGTTPTDGTQVPESAGGGGGEGASSQLEHPIVGRVRSYLERNGLTAQNAGFSISTANLYKILAGEVQPRMSTLETLAKELDELERNDRAFMREIGVEEVASNEGEKEEVSNTNGAGRGGAATEDMSGWEEIDVLATRAAKYIGEHGISRAEFGRRASVPGPYVSGLLNRGYVSEGGLRAIQAFLDNAENHGLEIDPSKIEVLPNRYDELNTGNPLPKYQAPTRCSRTP